jgi:hypothetical protein
MKTILDVISLLTPSNSRVVKELKPMADFLHLLQQMYEPICGNYPTCFCYETLATPVSPGNEMMIVPHSSAVISNIPEATTIAMPRDHVDLCKFSNPEDDAFILLITSLKSMADKASSVCTSRWGNHDGP